MLGQGDVLHLGEARLMGVYARHTEDSIGLVVEYGGLRLYCTADTLWDERLADIGALGIDILFTCINGRLGNMNVEEAAALARRLPCRTAVPVHYGMFAENTEDPQKFVKALAGSGIQTPVLEFAKARSVYDLL